MNYLPESEHSVLFCLLMNPSCFADCVLAEEDFSVEHAASVFHAIKQLHAEEEAIDPVVVSDWLSRKSGQNFWVSWVASVVSGGHCSVDNYKTYERLLKQESRNRNALSIMTELKDKVSSEGQEAIDTAIQRLMSLQNVQERYEKTMRETFVDSLKRIESRFESDSLAGIPTSIKKLDEALGGFHDRELYIFGARPAMGKTALMLNMAIAPDVPLGIISSEQAAEEIGERLFSISGGISAGRIRTGKLREEDWPALTACVSRLKKKDIWVNDKPGITLSELKRQARQWKFRHGIRALYVDYLQRIQTRPGDKTIDRIAEVSRGLKNIARELEIPVIALAQVKREVENRPNKRPFMGDLADCSEIEKEADGIMTIYRDEVYNEMTEDKGIAEISICKNRHGPTQTIKTYFVPNLMQFRDMEGAA